MPEWRGALALEHGFRRERVVAMLGEVIARWNSTLDTTVLTLIDAVKALAEDLDLDDGLHKLTEVEVEVLWSLGRYDDARSALQRDVERLRSRLHCQTADRWQNVRAGVDRLRQASVGEADALTGLPNRQFLGRWLPRILANDAPVCIGALNIDGFRNVNEQFGYEAGDRVLQEVAEVLERVCRRGDSVVRTNGDEFVMVLRDASPGDARIVFERVRQLIAARSWSSLPPDEHLSASVGATVGSGAMNSNKLAGDSERRAASSEVGRQGQDQFPLRSAARPGTDVATHCSGIDAHGDAAPSSVAPMAAQAWFSRSDIEVVPGTSAVFQLTVVNLGDTTESFSLAPVGLAAGWTTIRPGSVTLFGGSQEVVDVEVHPPLLPSTTAGPTALTVRIVPQSDPDDVGSSETTLQVGPDVHAPLAHAAARAPGPAHGRLRDDAREPGQHPGLVPPSPARPHRPGRRRFRSARCGRRARCQLADPAEGARHPAAVGAPIAHRAVHDRRRPTGLPHRVRAGHLRPGVDDSRASVRPAAGAGGHRCRAAGVWFGIVKPAVRDAADDAVAEQLPAAISSTSVVSVPAAVPGRLRAGHDRCYAAPPSDVRPRHACSASCWHPPRRPARPRRSPSRCLPA